MTAYHEFKVCESATITSLPGGGKSLLLDGEHFPYHISAEGPTVEHMVGDVYIVNVPIIVFADMEDGVIWTR